MSARQRDWRARLIDAAEAVVRSALPCYDSDEGLSESYTDVESEALATLRAVLQERES